jgi:hypothetical protein
MAASTCVKCGSTSFDMVRVEPKASPYVLMFVQCSSCGGVVGVLESLNIGSLIIKLAARLGLDLKV